MKDQTKHSDQPDEIGKLGSSSQNKRPRFTGSSHRASDSLSPALNAARDLSIHVLRRDNLPPSPNPLENQHQLEMREQQAPQEQKRSIIHKTLKAEASDLVSKFARQCNLSNEVALKRATTFLLDTEANPKAPFRINLERQKLEPRGVGGMDPRRNIHWQAADYINEIATREGVSFEEAEDQYYYDQQQRAYQELHPQPQTHARGVPSGLRPMTSQAQPFAAPYESGPVVYTDVSHTANPLPSLQPLSGYQPESLIQDDTSSLPLSSQDHFSYQASEHTDPFPSMPQARPNWESQSRDDQSFLPETRADVSQEDLRHLRMGSILSSQERQGIQRMVQEDPTLELSILEPLSKLLKEDVRALYAELRDCYEKLDKNIEIRERYQKNIETYRDQQKKGKITPEFLKNITDTYRDELTTYNALDTYCEDKTIAIGKQLGLSITRNNDGLLEKKWHSTIRDTREACEAFANQLADLILEKRAIAAENKPRTSKSLLEAREAKKAGKATDKQLALIKKSSTNAHKIRKEAIEAKRAGKATDKQLDLINRDSKNASRGLKEAREAKKAGKATDKQLALIEKDKERKREGRKRK